VALTLVAFALRVWVLVESARIGADEAVVGLMARHILDGERPVFYWGQPYLGALDAYVVAALLAIFDRLPWVLYVPALCASTALVPLTWAIARHLGPPPAGLMAALLIAVPTPMFSRMLGNAGGFGLGFALQFGAVLCALRALDAPRHRDSWILSFALLAGVAAWVWQPALLALLPICIVLLIQSRAHAVAAMAPLLIGLAPMLFYNVTAGFPTVAALVSKFSDQPASGLELSVIVVALGGGEETLGGANPMQAVLLTLALVVQPILVFVLATRRSNSMWRSRVRATALVLVVALLSAAAAHAAARYLVPLVATAIILSGATLATLGRWTRLGLAIALALELATVAVGNLRDYADVPNVMAAEQLSRVDDMHAAVGALEGRGLSTGYADYWTAYPITLLSEEQIVIAPSLPLPWGKGVDRHPAYTRAVDAVDNPADLFLLVDTDCTLGVYLASLDATGATYQLERVARWWLVWNIQSVADSEGATRAALQQAVETATPC
jgi:hypothetical protein